MQHVDFKALTEDDMEEMVRWHQDDELARRYGGKDWPERLPEILAGDPNRSCWIAWRDGERIAYVDFERHPAEHLAWIGLAVSPSLRGQGIGSGILREFLLRPEVQTFREIRAGIEPDNAASIRCFSAAGFRPLSTTPDEEGIVDYSLVLE